jgi:glutamine cyclotransferase
MRNKKRHSPAKKFGWFQIKVLSALTGLGAFLWIAFFPLPGLKAQGPAIKIPVFNCITVNTYPHDPQAFTQGLIFLKGFLYESTGLQGRSSLRQVELESGKVLKQHDLPGHFFGEGLTHWKDRLIQLTWRSGTGLVYERETFRLLRKFAYATEGWGLTQDGRHLIMSDGSARLYFLDPDTFREIRRLEVREGDQPLRNINELEFINGEVLANIFMTDRIARISLKTGRVTGWIDCKGLLSPKESQRPVDVLNGIAYDAGAGRLFVTGKLWPKLFEIRIGPRQLLP